MQLKVSLLFRGLAVDFSLGYSGGGDPRTVEAAPQTTSVSRQEKSFGGRHFLMAFNPKRN